MDTDDDDRLRAALRAWRVEPTIPPSFAQGVWARIAARAAPPPRRPSWLQRAGALLTAFAGPRLAFGAVALGLTFGAFAGAFEASHLNAALEERLATQYVRAIDPYYAPPRSL